METAGPIDPAVLSTKTNEELRHLLAVLRQKETDEQLNVNYSPYSSQRVIAEGRLATVRAKIRQVETEFDRRRSVAIPLPLPTLTSRAIQQFAESRCTFGIADAHLFEPYVQGRMFESPDPFSHCHRSHKKLCLQPREYFQDSVCIRRNVKIRDTSDTGTAMYKDAGTGESRKEKGVESKSSVEICTCETTSSEESVDEDKKKLRLDIDQREDGINSKSALKVSPHIVTRAEVCGELEKEERKEETDERAKDDEMEKIREEKSIDARIDSRERIKIKNEVRMLKRIEKRSEIIGPIQMRVKSRESVRMYKGSKTDVSKKKVFDCKYISTKELEESEEHDKKESIEKDGTDVSIKDKAVEKTTKANEIEVSKKQVVDCKYISIKQPEESEEYDKKKMFHVIRERRKENQKTKKITSEPKLELESIEKDVSIKDKQVEKTTKANEIEVSKKQVVDCKYISIKQPEESEEHDKKKMFHVIRERRKENQKMKKITSEPKLELESTERDGTDVSIKDKQVEKTTKVNEIEVSKKQVVDCKYISIKQPEKSEEHDKKKIFHVTKERKKGSQKTKNVISEPKLELENIEKDNADVSIKDKQVEKTTKANEIEVSKKQVVDCKYISIKKPEETEEHDKKKMFHVIRERRKENQKTKNITSEPKLELENIEKDDADVSIKDKPVEKTTKSNETEVSKKQVVNCKYICIKQPEKSEEHDKKKMFHVIRERRKENQKTKNITSEPKLELENIEKDDADISIKNKPVEKTTKPNEIEVSKKQVIDCKYICIKQPEESEEHDKKKMFHARERRKENQKTKKITSEPKLELENIEKDDADVSIKDKTVEKMTKPNEIEVSKKQMVDCKYICIKQPEETEEHDKKKMFHVIRERRKENQKSKNVMTEPKLELETIEKNDEDISIKNEPVEKTSEANKTDALKKMMLDYKCISIKKPEESEEHDKKKIFHVIKERRKENQKPKNVTSEPKLELESVEKDDADVSIKDEPIKKTKDEADILKKKVVDYKYVMEAEENDEDDNKKIFHVIKERKRESKRKKEIKSDRIKLENLEKDDADVSIKDEKSKFAYFPFKKLEKLKKTISHSTCTPDKENAKDDKVEKDDEVAKDEEVEKDERNKFEKKKNVQFVSTMTHVKYDKNFGDFYGWDIKEYSVQTTENQWQETVECDSSKDVGEEDETENDGVYFLSKKENCSIVFGNQKSIPVSTSIEMSNMIEKCTIAEKMFPKNCRINGK